MKSCRVLIASAAFGLSSQVALADCEADARAAMLFEIHPTPMRQIIVNEVGGNYQTKNTALSTPDGREVLLDAEGRPYVLKIDNRTYTSGHWGEPWTLTIVQSQQEFEERLTALHIQAESATDITCDYGIELDGKKVNSFETRFEVDGTGHPVTGRYWVDAETGFPWRAVLKFSDVVITVDNEPMPHLIIVDPDGQNEVTQP